MSLKVKVTGVELKELFAKSAIKKADKAKLLRESAAKINIDIEASPYEEVDPGLVTYAVSYDPKRQMRDQKRQFEDKAKQLEITAKEHSFISKHIPDDEQELEASVLIGWGVI